jgi:hypothetical protein
MHVNYVVAPVKKEEWKRTINKAINFIWKTQLLETKKLYKNLQYLNVGNPYYKGIHNLLRINCKSARDVDRIPVKWLLKTKIVCIFFWMLKVSKVIR